VALIFSARGWRHQRRTMLSIGMAASIFFAILFIFAQIRSLTAEPFLPSTNAYGSIFFTLNGFVLLLVLVGICLLIGTLARVIRKGEPLSDPRLVLWLQNSEMFFLFSVCNGLCVFLVLYLVPRFL
jgi:heme/copper-type cytochrome/quinol oxidase subunit 3